MSKIQYPETKRDHSVVEDLHGTKVADPYRWLEDPDSEETKEWIGRQNVVYNEVISKCVDKDQIFKRLKEMQNYPKYTCPFKQGDSYYFWKNSGLQNQSVLYKQKTLEEEAQVFLDPNTWSVDGTSSIGVYKFSESAKYFAYAKHKSGSDWKSIHIKEVDTGKEFDEVLEWVRFSGIAWTHDDKGFYYCQYPKPESFTNKENEKSKGTETDAAKDQKIYYHLLGTSQEDDKLIYCEPTQPEWMFGMEVTDDGRYLIITISPSCENVNRFYYVDLTDIKYQSNGMVEPVKLIDNFEAMYSYITNDDTKFYLQTNKNAPKYKVVSMDIHNHTQIEDIIKEHEKDVIEWITCINNEFIINYTQDAKQVLKKFSMTGNYQLDFPVPTVGSVTSATGKRNHKEMFYSFISFLHPGVIYHYDFVKKESVLFREIKSPNFNADLFETKQIFFKSKDGTQVPMFVVHRKGIEMNGNNPTMIYGYGGFYHSLTPSFSVSRVIWMSQYNGVYVLANIRGGNEYGEEWHKQGILDKKQNVFDDFCCAAESLISLGYTSPKKIAINGGSNGGLLVCACINQRPDLFGVAVAQVPVADMLRFHKFTIGYAWTSDYGCADKAEDFKYLIEYSPIHNVKKGKEFPALMVCTADHDDRVVPLHSFKYISEVQYQLANEEYQKNPLVIRIESKAGHGHGKPMEKILEEYSEIYAFIAHHLDAKWQD